MKLTSAFTLFLAVLSFHAQAQQIIDGADGKKILLNEDGSWEYVEESQLVDTNQGTAVIKPDNTWQYVEQPVTNRGATTPSTDENGVVVISMNRSRTNATVQTETLSYDLNEVYISEKETRSNIVKAARRSSAVHFNVRISAQTATALPALDKRGLSVRDSRGTSYDVVEASLSGQDVSAGNNVTLTVITDDSPMRILRVREIYLEIDSDVLGNPNPLKFTRSMSQVQYTSE